MKDKKHILLLTSSYPSSREDARAAAGLFVADFAHELSNYVHVSIITQNTDNKSYYIKDNDISIYRFSWFGKDRPLSTLRIPKDIHLLFSIIFGGMFATFRYVRKHDIDHILCLWTVPCGLWALPLKYIFGII